MSKSGGSNLDNLLPPTLTERLRAISRELIANQFLSRDARDALEAERQLLCHARERGRTVLRATFERDTEEGKAA